jgi:hypothetical protein
MELDHDFNEFVALLATHDVRYMIVGGYALAAHGLPRATGRPQDIADVLRLTANES